VLKYCMHIQYFFHHAIPLRLQNPVFSLAQLQQISGRYGGDPLVHRLLVEIRALQVIVRRAYQVAESAGLSSREVDAFGIAVAALHEELSGETWFQEELAERKAYRERLAAGDASPNQMRSRHQTRKP
jgi:hypothetical protein